jgi:hypothetical protein
MLYLLCDRTTPAMSNAIPNEKAFNRNGMLRL